MTWSTLKSRLAIDPTPIPYVLAGPILRDVTPLRVTVWFALRAAATVKLRVFNGATQLLEGSRHTTAIGTNLHIVAVTAALIPPMTGMTEGTVYEYDALFDFDDATVARGMSLTMASGNRSFGYAPFERPSFSIPPRDLNNLRIIHGSCRHANGEGPDSLALVDRLIKESAANAMLRPHQMLFMGDQIYADDVGGSMLMMLTEASDALLGWEEVLPVLNTPSGMRGNELPPYWRYEVALDAKFTSDAQWNHILTLGEYLCMYLFVWSDVLWDAGGNFPQYADVEAAVKRDQSTRAHLATFELNAHKAAAKEDIANVGELTNSLANVRRAMANVPIYMILDDHDVTDDYNMTRNIATGVYGNPMGRRLVQNALTAYAICQHWGNVPDQFDEKKPSAAGTQLLAQFSGMTAAKYDSISPTLQHLVGVHDDKAIMKPPGSTTPGVFHDADALVYNYTIEGTGHQIIVTDSRTWRTFPNAGDEAPELLPQAQIDAQIGIKPATGDRALIVVLSTNMPPVPIIRFATRHPTMSNAFEYFPDLFDSWELPSFPFDRLTKALTDRLAHKPGEPITGSVILLSGDVHSSFATRTLFTGTARLNDPSTAVNVVFAQLISSSLRNQTGRTVAQHHDGYDYHADVIGKKAGPEAYAGWNITAPEHVLDRVNGPDFRNPVPEFVTIHASRTLPVRLRATMSASFLRKPDWGYRLDYLKATNQGNVPTATATLPPFAKGGTKEELKAAVEQYKTIAGDYRNYRRRNTKREMVGVTNVSEVTFQWGAGSDKRVLHTVRWRDPDAKTVTGTNDSSEDGQKPLLFTTYAVSLDPNDKAFTYEELTGTKVGP